MCKKGLNSDKIQTLQLLKVSNWHINKRFIILLLLIGNKGKIKQQILQ